jgi:hypothetical protein
MNTGHEAQLIGACPEQTYVVVRYGSEGPLIGTVSVLEWNPAVAGGLLAVVVQLLTVLLTTYDVAHSGFIWDWCCSR